MLTWKKENGVWLGNGFRVEPSGPNAWVLEDSSAPPAAAKVSVDVTGPFVTRTLRSCKHEAELRHRRQALRTQRERLAAIAVTFGLMAVMLEGLPLASIGLGVVAAAAGLELIRSLLAPVSGDAREVTQ